MGERNRHRIPSSSQTSFKVLGFLKMEGPGRRHVSEALSYMYYQESGCTGGSTKKQTQTNSAFIVTPQVSKIYTLVCIKPLLGNSKMRVKKGGSGLAIYACISNISKQSVNCVINLLCFFFHILCKET